MIICLISLLSGLWFVVVTFRSRESFSNFFFIRPFICLIKIVQSGNPCVIVDDESYCFLWKGAAVFRRLAWLVICFCFCFNWKYKFNTSNTSLTMVYHTKTVFHTKWLYVFTSQQIVRLWVCLSLCCGFYLLACLSMCILPIYIDANILIFHLKHFFSKCILWKIFLCLY